MTAFPRLPIEADRLLKTVVGATKLTAEEVGYGAAGSYCYGLSDQEIDIATRYADLLAPYIRWVVSSGGDDFVKLRPECFEDFGITEENSTCFPLHVRRPAVEEW